MNNEKKSILKEVLDWVKTIVLALLIAFIITHVFIINAIVPSNSMESTINIGDRLVANRLSYLFSEPQRGDIIIFPNPDDESVLFVKRVIGLPNETVQIINGEVYIDGNKIDEEYVSSEIIDNTKNSKYEVPEGTVFCLGDNRLYSRDARYWNHTYLDIDKIKGKVCFRYFPWPKVVK